MFQNQLAAVDSDTALARILLGKISAGYVHDTGPHVVAKVATNRYEHDTMAEDTGRFWYTIHVMSLLFGVRVSPVLGWP
jgi:hypothetical protein